MIMVSHVNMDFDNNASPKSEMMAMTDDIDQEKEIVGSNDTNIKKRETWNRTIDFLVACIGGSVGLGNVWRFPYLCYRNGGGAFLIPYFLCMIFGSLPLFMLEVAIGQYTSSGGMQAWNLVPLFQGIGFTTTIIMFYLNCYYNTILAWTFVYLFQSFASKLPWDTCDEWWNTPLCVSNYTEVIHNRSLSNGSTVAVADPVTEFWERKVLGLSNGIEDMGIPKWDIVLGLLLAWVIVYLCICKGIRSTGKVMYFTAPAPYVFMIIILIRNATLPGAADGVSYYLKPNLTKLTEMSVWTDAAKQTFYSSSVCQGIAVVIGSYNKFKHNCCRDTVVFSIVNAFTSFFSGFLVFTILGFMSYQQGVPISEVAESGPGLAFIAYPKAVTQMPLSQFWAVAFFLMLLFLGLDSQFVGCETVITSILDQFPHVLRRGYRKEIFIAVLCVVMCCVGLIFTFNGGMYVFQLFDFYCGGRVLILVGFLEVAIITYFYGLRRFRDNLEMMVGRKWSSWMFPYLAICWTSLTPLMCLVLFIISAMDYEDLTYSRPNESVYKYPLWALGLGWVLTLSSVIFIPGVAVYKCIKYGFSSLTLKLMLLPYELKPHQMRPQDKLERTLRHFEQEKRHIDDS